jgi:hypothetical protein
MPAPASDYTQKALGFGWLRIRAGSCLRTPRGRCDAAQVSKVRVEQRAQPT